METYQFINHQLTGAFPEASVDLIETITDTIYGHILKNQGKQSVDSFERADPEKIENAIMKRIKNGWQVFLLGLVGESTVSDPSNPGTPQPFLGMSGVIIYNKN